MVGITRSKVISKYRLYDSNKSSPYSNLRHLNVRLGHPPCFLHKLLQVAFRRRCSIHCGENEASGTSKHPLAPYSQMPSDAFVLDPLPRFLMTSPQVKRERQRRCLALRKSKSCHGKPSVFLVGESSTFTGHVPL